MRVAKESWRGQLWRELPIRDEQLPRMFSDQAGRMPYIKDVFDIAWKMSQHGDIIVYTNADICVRSDCAMLIAFLMQGRNVLYGFRRDFYQELTEPIPDTSIATGAEYAGCDLFAFRAAWWGNQRKDFPDLLLGRESWDAVLRTIMDWEQPVNDAAVFDLIYHQKHSENTHWENGRNRLQLKGQLYVRRLTSQWCARKGIENLVAP